MKMVFPWATLLFAAAIVGAGEAPKPAAYWDFNEGEGMVAANKAGTPFGPIALVGSPEWTPNASGFCVKFDNSKDRVQYGETSSVPFVGKIESKAGATFTFWALPINGGTVPGNECGYVLGSQAIYLGITNDHWMELYYDGKLRSFTGPALKRGQWTHIAFAWNEVFVRFYVDGKEFCPPGGPLLTSGLLPIDCRAPFFIASMDPYFGLTKRFVGYLDDLKFYEQVLTPEEVRSEYAAGVAERELKK